MLKFILLLFSLSLSFSETIITNKDNLGSIPDNETHLTLELRFIIFIFKFSIVLKIHKSHLCD